MSLLNDMLRDLSARQKDRPLPEDSTELLVDSSLVRDEPFPWRLSLTVFALVLVLTFLLLHLWPSRDSAAQITEPGLVQADENSQPVEVYELPLEPEKADAPVLQMLEKSQADEQAAAEVEKLLEQWLQLGEKALARDRLSSPAEDNAVYYFARALQLAPDNERALAGQLAVVVRYRQLIRESLVAGNESRAAALLTRALQQAPADEDLVYLQEEIDRAKVKTQQPKMQIQPASSAVAILPSAEWRDQQAVQSARELLQQGDRSAAIAYLEDYLGRDPEAAQVSARLLCQMYLETGELTKADLLLSEANNWPVVEHARLRALWLQASGQEAEARRLLEAHLAEAAQDEAYRALLAQLYYTAGDYHQAVASYRRLLDSFGEKPGYWLGLALGLDALGQGSSALVAYQNSLASGAQEKAVTDYIETRIKALSR